MQFISRRRLLIAAAASALAACAGPARRPIRVGGMFSGSITDRGFMEAGYLGLKRAEAELGASLTVLERIPNNQAAHAEALRKLAAASPDLIVAHGGQTNPAAQAVAAEFPQVRFVVTQGNVSGPNLASYEVLQEQSTYLAGALAGMLTKSGIVGHQSGIRVPPGLRGRAAFAAGLAAANPKARLLTNFSGTQDDPARARQVTKAQIDAGADIVYTMLNAGRSGSIDECKARGMPQIGNVTDWVAMRPDVFVGSAWADVGIAAFNACADVSAGRFAGAVHKRIGLEDPAAIRLIVADRVAPDIRARLETMRRGIVDGSIRIPTEYNGPEFDVPA
jgi:basic membrane protein A